MNLLCKNIHIPWEMSFADDFIGTKNWLIYCYMLLPFYKDFFCNVQCYMVFVPIMNVIYTHDPYTALGFGGFYMSL